MTDSAEEHELDATQRRERPDGDADLAPARPSGAAPTDVQLQDALDRARTGDEHGFALLWRTLHPPLLRYLTVRSPDAREDVASETWVQVVRDLPGFGGDVDEFRGWLFTIARNRAIDHGRTRVRRSTVPVAAPSEHVADPLTASAEDDAVARSSTEEAVRLVASLPVEQAEMVMLRVVAGLDVAVVARLVGKKPGTVRVAVHRALKELARDPRARALGKVV
ncbi:RNA polymerase sigma factor [Nocardioides baculatus]|uniref:RNA polymerase sigma factor n=1 Tax=Nocardioides baculatus TaxID=2801337 RepID=A0ABS1L8V4_9ACTN|nr:RNA polymerase sigma factor [Nocardioides baculatus]MBL0748055.1 RNA polymerase sigma factor [Nocardioides baculatus]